MTRLSALLFSVIFMLLLPTLAGCGELEIPVRGEDPNHETTESEEENESDEKNEGDERDEKDEGDEGDEKEPAGDEKPHSVGYATFTDDGHLLIDDSLYLSVYEVRNVLSAYSDSPKEALEKAEKYEEGNIKDGWRIPTEKEVNYLLGMYASHTFYYGDEPLPVLNRALEAWEYDLLSFDYRYLCAEGQKTFCFEAGKNISKAGTKTLYRLRLVHSKE